MPLIDGLKLKHTAATFPLYTNDKISLVISGIGKCRSAAATSWLGAQSETPRQGVRRCKSTSWLNIGIAGHNHADIGSIFTAHKIHDYGSKKIWYPPRISAPLLSENLTTVDTPLTEYIPDQLHDMEGSGFIETARIYSYAELVQCIKVVSDNTERPFTEINTKLAAELIENSVESIIHFANHLQGLAEALDTPDITIFEEFLKKWKFSVSQKIILERLLQRHSVLHEPMTKLPENVSQLATTKEALYWLTELVNNADHTL